MQLFIVKSSLQGATEIINLIDWLIDLICKRLPADSIRDSIRTEISDSQVTCTDMDHIHSVIIISVIFVNENENENYQKRKNNDFVNEN